MVIFRKCYCCCGLIGGDFFCAAEGLESSRPHMLLGIIVRQKLKRASMDREAETPAKNSVSAKGSSADGAKTSNARKLGVWKAEGETEAYSPSAGVGCGEDGVTGMEPLYIPTPNIPASSATPNLSTPSSSRSSSVGKIDADCTGERLRFLHLPSLCNHVAFRREMLASDFGIIISG